MPSRRRFVIAGGVIGILAPCLLSLNLNERSWEEYADYYGPGYHRLLGLLTEFPIPVFLSGIAGSVAGYFFWLASSPRSGFQARTLAGGAVAGAALANLIAMAVYSSELFHLARWESPLMWMTSSAASSG